MIKKISERLRRAEKSNFIRIFLVAYIFLLCFFLSSKVWYPDKESEYVQPTEFGKTVTFQNRDFTLKRWDYSEKQRIMEVEFQILDHSTDGIKHLYYEAVDINKGKLQTEVVFEETNLIIIRIKELPEKWSQISLRLKLSETEDKVLKYYTNKTSVNKVDAIEDKTKEEYFINRAEADKEHFKSEIKKQQDMIADYETKIDNANENISELMASKKYQTEEEQLDTDKAIQKLEDDILAYQKEIEKIDGTIREYEEKIRQTEEKINGQ